MSDELAAIVLEQLITARLEVERALRLLDPTQHLRPATGRRLLSSDSETITLPARVQ